jgi:hypothetical protein
MLVITAMDGHSMQERTVALVGLGHHVLAAAQPGVAAERAEAAADDRRRIEARALQHERDHRRGRGLAVRARDGHRKAQPHQLRQHLAREESRARPAARLDDFGIGRPHGGRLHHDVGLADVAASCPSNTRTPHADSRREVTSERFASDPVTS